MLAFSGSRQKLDSIRSRKEESFGSFFKDHCAVGMNGNRRDADADVVVKCTDKLIQLPGKDRNFSILGVMVRCYTGGCATSLDDTHAVVMRSHYR